MAGQASLALRVRFANIARRLPYERGPPERAKQAWPCEFAARTSRGGCPMSADLQIVLTAGLVATACGLLGPFLVLRRVALMGDAVSHAVLPGIVATFLLLGTRAPLPVIVGAAVFAVLCVLAIEALRSTGLVQADAAIGLVFPALFSLGVLGVTRWTSNLHLDLDATIYGEIAFVPLQQWSVAGLVVPRAVVIVGSVAIVNLALVTALW